MPLKIKHLKIEHLTTQIQQFYRNISYLITPSLLINFIFNIALMMEFLNFDFIINIENFLKRLINNWKMRVDDFNLLMIVIQS